jgi:hypothetical protein
MLPGRLPNVVACGIAELTFFAAAFAPAGTGGAPWRIDDPVMLAGRDGRLYGCFDRHLFFYGGCLAHYHTSV